MSNKKKLGLTIFACCLLAVGCEALRTGRLRPVNDKPKAFAEKADSPQETKVDVIEPDEVAESNISNEIDEDVPIFDDEYLTSEFDIPQKKTSPAGEENKIPDISANPAPYASCIPPATPIEGDEQALKQALIAEKKAKQVTAAKPAKKEPKTVKATRETLELTHKLEKQISVLRFNLDNQSGHCKRLRKALIKSRENCRELSTELNRHKIMIQIAELKLENFVAANGKTNDTKRSTQAGTGIKNRIDYAKLEREHRRLQLEHKLLKLDQPERIKKLQATIIELTRQTAGLLQEQENLSRRLAERDRLVASQRNKLKIAARRIKESRSETEYFLTVR